MNERTIARDAEDARLVKEDGDKRGGDTQAWVGGSLGGYDECASGGPCEELYDVEDVYTRPSGDALRSLASVRTLVLDVSYQPVDVIPWQRAICYELFDKADVIEYYDNHIVRAPSAIYQVPAVVRTRVYVKRRSPREASLNRRNLYARDGYRCQYCGCTDRERLTIDHVHPVSRGGGWSWDNLVTACNRCNVRKGAMSVRQAGLKLATEPAPPTHDIFQFANVFRKMQFDNEKWLPYIPEAWVEERNRMMGHGTPASPAARRL
eukprot:PRCOL_00006758-RA